MIDEDTGEPLSAFYIFALVLVVLFFGTLEWLRGFVSGKRE